MLAGADGSCIPKHLEDARFRKAGTVHNPEPFISIASESFVFSSSAYAIIIWLFPSEGKHLEY